MKTSRRGSIGANAIRQGVARIFVYAVLIAIAMLYCFPFLWMVVSSFKFNRDVLAVPIRFLPPHWNWSSYHNVFFHPGYQIARYFLNSVTVTVSATCLCAIVSVAAGYGFSRYSFPGNGVLFVLVLSTMMIPFQAIVVPLFLLVRALGFSNTLLALVVPMSVSSFGVFMMRQFFYSVPEDMIEAARIEGARELRIFLLIAVPLSKTAVVALVIFHSQWVWNELLWPLVAVSNPKLRTVPQAISLFTGQYMTPYPEQLAMSVAACIPMLFLFAFLSRHFVQGVTLTGMKA